MADGAYIEWDIYLSDELIRGKQMFLKGLQDELAGVARAMQKYAQGNHPWQNRTGDAERLFTVRVVGDFTIEARHGVYYGIFLEYSNGGRYGVMPITMAFGVKEVMDAIRRAWIGAW